MEQKLSLLLLVFSVMIIFTAPCPVYSTPYSGTINQLSPDKQSYSNPGENIVITCQVTNDGKKNIPVGSTIYYEIVDSNNNVVSTHETSLNEIQSGGSYTDTWTTTNTGFTDIGSYDIKATWYDAQGHQNGHVIAGTKETAIYSVPSPWFITSIAAIVLAVGALAIKKKKQIK